MFQIGDRRMLIADFGGAYLPTMCSLSRLPSSQMLSMRSVSGTRRHASLTVHGFVYAFGSSIVTSIVTCPTVGREYFSVTWSCSVPGNPRMSSQVFPFCPIVSTINVSPSQRPTEYPIHVGCG